MSALWEQDPTYTTLRRYLLEHKDELIAMLHRWDEDSDGCINATEFRQACRVLQLDAGLKMKIPREVFDELYEELDVNNTENIPFDDLEIAVQQIPVPPPPLPLDTVDEDEEEVELAEEEQSPGLQIELSAAEWVQEGRRCRRRSKSLPTSPVTSPLPVRPPSPATSSRSTIPRGRLALPQLSPRGAQSNESSPVGRRSSQFQPPRRGNLPRLNRTREISDDSRSNASSRISGASSISISAMTPRQRMEVRMLREKELSRQLHRHNLPGFNVPGPGQYVSYDMGTGTIERRVEKAKAQQSPWAMDRMERSIGGNNLNMKHKTIIGDPGAYVSHDHEMSFRQKRAGNAALSFWSSMPQRPIGEKF